MLSNLLSESLYPRKLVEFILAAGCVTSITLFFALNLLFPEGHYPLWLFGALTLVYGFWLLLSRSTFFARYHREILVGILTISYLLALLLGYFNQLSFESVMLMLVAQTLYSISFRRLKHYLIFAFGSMSVFAIATYLTRHDFPNQMFVMLVLGAGTGLGGLYVNMKIFRSAQLIQLGDTMEYLLNQSAQAVIVLSQDLRACLYANSSGSALLAVQEITGDSMRDFLAKSRLDLTQLLSDAESEKPLLHEVVSPGAPDGMEAKRLLVRCSAVELLRKKGYLFAFQDVTALALKEQALKASLEQQASLLRAFPDTLALLDAAGVVEMSQQGDQPTYAFLPVFELGRPFVECWAGLLPPDDRAALSNMIRNTMHTGEPGLRRFVGVSPRTEPAYLEVHVTPYGLKGQLLVRVRDLSQAYHSELALKVSEENYRQVFELAFEGILVINTETWTIFKANEAACQILDCPKENLLGAQVSAFDAPGDSLSFSVFLSQVNTATGAARELCLICPNGKQVETEAAARWLDTPQQRFQLVMLKEVGERNAQARAIRLYANLIQNLDHAVMVLHLEDQTTDESLRIVSINTQASVMLGLDRDEVSGKKLDEAYPGWRVFKGPELVARSIASNQILTLDDLAYPGPDLIIQYWRIKVVPLHDRYAGVIFESVTEQKKHREALLAQARLLAHISDAVISMDMNFQIQSWNPAAESIYGWSAHEALGKDIRTLLMGDLFSGQEDQVLGQLRLKDQWTGEGYQNHKSGIKVFVTSTAALIRNAKGSPKSIVVVNHNVTQRRIWEDQMVRSERKFRDLFMFSPEAIIVINGDFKVVDINPSALKMLQSTRSRTIGSLVTHHISPEFQDRFTAQLPQLIHSHQPYFDISFQIHSGKVFPVEVRARAFERHGQPATILHLTDISQRLSADGQLHLFQSLVDYSSDLIFIVNFRTGQLTHFNKSTLRQLGYSESELISLHLFDLCLSIDLQPLPVRQIREVKSRGAHLVAGRLMKKDRSSIPVEINMAFLNMEQQEYIVCIARDISERLAQEEALRASEQRYRALVENMNEGIVLTDVEETILFTNDRLCEILGLPKESILGRRSYHIFDPHHREMILEKNALRLEGVADKYELTYGRADGKKVWLEIAGSPFLDASQRVTGTIAIVNDISARKDAENRLLEKNRELDAFVYRASHDLRGPLSSIIGIVNLSRTRSEDPYWLFELVDQSANRLVSILQELEQVTRFRNSAKHHTLIDLGQMVEDIFATLRCQPEAAGFQFEKQIQLSRPLFLDSRLLNAVLLNLIGNGFKYRNPNANAPFVRVFACDKGEQIILKVEDNGVGIPDSLQPRVFDMFYRGHIDSKGSGLGLYIVKNAVEKLEGSIQMESREGQGSIFSLFLPNHYLDLATANPDLVSVSDSN